MAAVRQETITTIAYSGNLFIESKVVPHIVTAFSLSHIAFDIGSRHWSAGFMARGAFGISAAFVPDCKAPTSRTFQSVTNTTYLLDLATRFMLWLLPSSFIGFGLSALALGAPTLEVNVVDTNLTVATPAHNPNPAPAPDNSLITSDQSVTSKDPLFKEVQPGIFQLGAVIINRQQRTVSFPAMVNLRKGAMEYFLVSSWGKVHESILRTDTEPYRIHIAMLLLGAKGAGTNADDNIDVPAPFVSHPSSMRLPGDDVSIEIKWKETGKERRRRAEELVFNKKTHFVLRRGNWVYNGSLMEENTFFAQREGSIISLVTDPEALVNNTGSGHDDDTIWTPKTTSLPPADAVLEVIIKLNRKPKAKR